MEVSLHRPPPLERPLTLEVDGEGAKLLDGQDVVATARPARPPDPGPTVPIEEVRRAVAVLDLDQYRAQHAYPGCFTCGPAREPGDGLRLFPAPTPLEGVFVAEWTPHDSMSDGTGFVGLPVIWAALDCPGGISWLGSDPELPPVVLGRLAASIRRRPAVGEALIATGWTKEADGRKRTAGSSLRSQDGELIAAGHATWIVLTEEQMESFQAAARRS